MYLGYRGVRSKNLLCVLRKIGVKKNDFVVKSHNCNKRVDLQFGQEGKQA